MKTRKFQMYRGKDKSGISGVGWIMEGVEFFNGKVCITWHGKVKSISVYDSFQEFVETHIDNHSNETVILWEDGSEITYE